MVHASLSSVGDIRGGAETMLGALSMLTNGVMAPAFTYKTMLIPETGPDDNAIDYGTGKNLNRMAEFFTPEMPADPLMGVLSECLRKQPGAKRSAHPILSFVGTNVDAALSSQTFEEPLAPIGTLAQEDSIVLLIGVNHTVNTSIHFAERLAGRKQFTRWALTPQGVKECPGFPACSDGFEQASAYLEGITRTSRVGSARVRAIPLQPMISTLTNVIREQPDAFLCHKAGCLRCEAVRSTIA